jgi:hypothetical protein
MTVDTLVIDNHSDMVPEGLEKDIMELRRVASRNIFRACQIPDTEVAALLVKEASVMLTVVIKVEEMLERL